MSRAASCWQSGQPSLRQSALRLWCQRRVFYYTEDGLVAFFRPSWADAGRRCSCGFQNCRSCSSSAELNTSFPRCLDIETSKHILFRTSLLFTRHCTGPTIALRRRWGRSGKASGDRMVAKNEMGAVDVRMMINQATTKIAVAEDMVFTEVPATLATATVPAAALRTARLPAATVPSALPLARRHFARCCHAHCHHAHPRAHGRVQ